jgi:hypothetical protein
LVENKLILLVETKKQTTVVYRVDLQSLSATTTSSTTAHTHFAPAEYTTATSASGNKIGTVAAMAAAASIPRMPLSPLRPLRSQNDMYLSIFEQEETTSATTSSTAKAYSNGVRKVVVAHNESTLCSNYSRHCDVSETAIGATKEANHHHHHHHSNDTASHIAPATTDVLTTSTAKTARTTNGRKKTPAYA